MRPQRIQIVCPAKSGSRFGNRITALRWQRILRSLGHQTRIVSEFHPGADLLVALHARRSVSSIEACRERDPACQIVVAITGTDLYRDGATKETKRSLMLADRVVVLQRAALDALSPAVRVKSHVIHQSLSPLRLQRPTRPRALRVVVAGHLRAVKDPFRAAMAVRNLPRDSKVVVEHFGGVIEPRMRAMAQSEAKRNPRYRWHREVTRGKLKRQLATCWLMVLSSKMEGGANVLSEAIVHHTPVLASKIPGSIGMLGEDYKGFFEVGNTQQLHKLLMQCERDADYYRELEAMVAARAHLFTPSAERKAWQDLLTQLNAARG